MVSIQQQVSEALENDENLTLEEVKKKFSNLNPIAVKSAFYRARKVSKRNGTNDTSGKITMEMVESLLVKQLKKKKDTATLRLMVDFLKIKQQDHSELEEIDLEIFYKKAMEE